MPLFPRRPRLLPLQMPQLDGTSWPGRSDVGRASFDALTLYQMGYREAFEPEAHDIADLLVTDVLPVIAVDDAAPEDEPYLRRVFTTAAQVGAGIGIVERQVAEPDERSTDRRIWGALWQARRELPAMPQDRHRVAAYLLQCGHYIARTHPATVPLLLAALSGEDDRRGS